ncbi:MAG: hypothetical protein RLZZ502_1599 [Pseudomonadota bacterium]
MKVLVTGGTGYIGSMTVVALIEAGHEVFVVDSLVNSKQEVLSRIEKITQIRPGFQALDVRDASGLLRLCQEKKFDAIIHFAALKAVGESTEQPLAYYENNLCASMNVMSVMRAAHIPCLVFSSSATVYAADNPMPLTESAQLGASNPYGQTKLMTEQIMRDAALAYPDLSLLALRYFNPVGAHASGLLGEDPNGVPNNLVPYIAQVAVGRRTHLRVWGNDYPTHDGTGVRDYIHVADLARGHVAALQYGVQQRGFRAINLGTGKGHSVLDMLRAFGQACGKELAHEILPRRPGDVAANWADPALAQQLLGWEAQHDLARMCADTWRWQSLNPNGYEHS